MTPLPQKTLFALNELAVGRIEIVTPVSARAILARDDEYAALVAQLQADLAIAQKRIEATVAEHAKLVAQVVIEEARAVRAERTKTKLRHFAARIVVERDAAAAEARFLKKIYQTPATPASPGENEK